MTILSQFQSVGQNLFNQGLVSATSGNLSIRMGEHLIITRRGSKLNHLQEHDLIETGITKDDQATPQASTELAVHRATYQQTPASAIVHAHPPYAIALSLKETEIVPSDAGGLSMLSRVPVLGWGMKVRPGGLAEIIAPALKKRRIIMVHGHGSFAIGQSLEEAYGYTTTLETSCQILYSLKSLKISTEE